jgi:HPr kinase/phosphorylase
MKTLAGQEIHPRISVRHFLQIFTQLNLRLVGGEKGLDRLIENPRIQKPGLALAGVYEYVHPYRVQILGNTEISFINRQAPAKRLEMLRPIFEKKVCCFIVTKSLEPPPELVAAAEETDTPLLSTPERSSVTINTITDSMHSALAPILTVHGDLLDVYGVGLLLIGKGSIGKSESALDLVVRGHRLVSDDVVEIRRRGDILTGAAPELTRYHMELRGIGIINIKDLFGVGATRLQKDVDIVIEMEHWKEDGAYDRLGLDDHSISILGIPVPYLLMPVGAGRNVTILLEVAVRNLLLKRQGIHTARAFARRLQESLEPKSDDT